MEANTNVLWQPAKLTSPHFTNPVAVVLARNIAYVANGNRLQNLSIYLPNTAETRNLVGTAVTTLPKNKNSNNGLPDYHVHIHGGAWRDPNLLSNSIETVVAHAFSDIASDHSIITAIISLNYTLSPFPTHPTFPYDPTVKNPRADPAREAKHPAHIRDVLHGFSLLRSLGLLDGSYILSGHSCGACLAFQAALQPSQHWGNEGSDGYIPEDIPRPAALLGLNGLYDLPRLVDGLGASHAHLKDVYADLLGTAFGSDRDSWPAASPAHLIEPDELSRRVREGQAPPLVLVDQSPEDELVPMNQMETMKAQLEKVSELHVVRGGRCVGEHAAPWKQGDMIWETVKDTLKLLATKKSRAPSTTSKRVLTIFGATGNQGHSVIDIILANPELREKYALRGVTRNASSPSAQTLIAKNVEMVSANVNDIASLRAAIRGSHGVFGVTNFWDKDVMSKTIEVQQGKNIFEACREENVVHFVYSTLPYALKITDGVLQHIDHFDGKAVVAEHIEANKGRMIASYFMPAMYMKSYKDQIQVVDGTPSLIMPFEPRDAASWPVLDPRADSGKYIVGLFEGGKSANGVRVNAVSAWTSPRELTAAIAREAAAAAKKEEVVVAIKSVTPETMKASLPENIAQEITETMLLVGGFGYYGLGEERRQERSDGWLVGGTETRTLEQVVRSCGPWDFQVS